MRYIGVTQQTASWLLTHPTLLESLHDLVTESDELPKLRHADLVEGSFRLSGSPDGRLLSIWNVDYLTGTGNEEWGFIKRDSPLGLLGEPTISREVLERCIYVINQRLQNLLLDSAFFHREHDNSTNTCLAGRGSDARQFSIGYVETDVSTGTGRTRAVLCIGPSHRFNVLTNAIAEEAKTLGTLVKLANESVAPQRRRPVLDTTIFAGLRRDLSPNTETESDLSEVTVPSLGVVPEARDVYRTVGWTYEQWVAPDSVISSAQRRILESDGILKHPIRIIGPGGSGKTLLMQLLAVRRLVAAREANKSVAVLYIVHNAAMAQSVRERFDILGASEYLNGSQQHLKITTLSEYGKQQLQLTDTGIIDVDAHETKLFQLNEVENALRSVLQKLLVETVQESELLKQVAINPDLFAIFSRLVMAEISSAIKGHGLTNDKQRYVGSERQLSRFHGVLRQGEREVVYETFREYHHNVFEELEVLDADDIALSLLGKMRTPIWDLKRKEQGYDFVFVDETQLFNENERRIFPLLSRGTTSFIPIVLALDEAQELYGQSTAGFGALGIRAIENESLASNHRSTRAIVDLAFFVIQRTTDLFGADFPDFTGAVATMEPEGHPLAAPPRVDVCNEEAKSFPRFVVKLIRELRRSQLRQIAVVCHAESYWEPLQTELRASDFPLHILLKRGDPLVNNQPLVALTLPAYVGGQEFDAVIAVGLEQGLVPARVQNNDALAAAVEQQALREMYLTFTRARYQLRVAINRGAVPTRVLQEAIDAGLLATDSAAG
jgi:superfamily I DNA/RNA helicase